MIRPAVNQRWLKIKPPEAAGEGEGVGEAVMVMFGRTRALAGGVTRALRISASSVRSQFLARLGVGVRVWNAGEEVGEGVCTDVSGEGVFSSTVGENSPVGGAYPESRVGSSVRPG